MATPEERRKALEDILEQACTRRLDGAMGTMLQQQRLDRRGLSAGRRSKRCNENLVRTRPDVVAPASIALYLEAARMWVRPISFGGARLVAGRVWAGGRCLRAELHRRRNSPAGGVKSFPLAAFGRRRVHGANHRPSSVTGGSRFRNWSRTFTSRLGPWSRAARTFSVVVIPARTPPQRQGRAGCHSTAARRAGPAHSHYGFRAPSMGHGDHARGASGGRVCRFDGAAHPCCSIGLNCAHRAWSFMTDHIRTISEMGPGARFVLFQRGAAQ